MNLNSILIGSENPQALKEYYGKVFGKPVFEDGDFSSWQIGGGYMTVGSHDQVKGRNSDPGRAMWNIESSDVKGAGATVVQEPINRVRQPRCGSPPSPIRTTTTSSS